jgi:hypothetical protein
LGRNSNQDLPPTESSARRTVGPQNLTNGSIVITRQGKPAGVLIGFESEDDWFDYRLENDPRFLRRIAKARSSLQAGRGIRLDLEME